MPEIVCPHCNRAFTVDESEYASILQQVRTKEFDKELHDKLDSLEKAKSAELAQVKAEAEKAYDKALSEKEVEFEKLKAQLANIDKENGLKLVKLEKEKDNRIHQLETEIAGFDSDRKLAVANAISEYKSKIIALESALKASDDRHELEINKQKAFYEEQERINKETIERYKDMRLKLSTKMLGETLEQHCQNSFNQIRTTAFPNAQFGKDNEVSAESHSKGDYIFRDYDGDVETISIMFDMKNEADATATKKTNESFLKELDKDRREKHCEYAVLVSMLEQDNDLYNTGIVDVSYIYPKMYVIRPQFFIPLISILSNEARKNADVKRKLIDAQNRQIDITNFEANIESFKDGFLKTVAYADSNFNEIEAKIEKYRDGLTAILATFTKMRNHFKAASNKLDDLTVKKLTRDNPTMQALFEANKE